MLSPRCHLPPSFRRHVSELNRRNGWIAYIEDEWTQRRIGKPVVAVKRKFADIMARHNFPAIQAYFQLG